MSEATLEVGGGSPGLRLSASQIEKFTTCEQRWLYTKTVPPEERMFASTEALDLGNLMHRLMGAWWSGRNWKAEWLTALVEDLGEDVGYRLSASGNLLERKGGWEAPRYFLRAAPIMEAWTQVHGRSPAKDPDPEWSSTSLVALEVPFDIPVPGTDARVRGFIDGVVSTPVDKVRVHDQVRLLEFKTMGRWGREDRVPFDPQLNLYLYAAKQMFDVQGAVFEAISTYDYKQGGPERRFKRIELPYDQRLVDRTLDNIRRIAVRAAAVLEDPDLAVRNVGDSCHFCDFKQRCLTPWSV